MLFRSLMCEQLINDCPCEYGCPSCVGLANLRPPLHQDPDLGGGYAIPDKIAGKEIMLRLMPALRHAAESTGAVGKTILRPRGDMLPLQPNLIKWKMDDRKK